MKLSSELVKKEKNKELSLELKTKNKKIASEYLNNDISELSIESVNKAPSSIC